jgi:beta-mannosidase
MQPTPVETSGRLSIANETPHEICGDVCWAVRDHSGKALRQGRRTMTVPAFSSAWLEKITYEGADFLTQYMSYEFVANGETVSSGTVLFTAPKHFCFLPPNLRCVREGDTITVQADAYARDVEIYSPDEDLSLSDNYFDIHGGSASVKLLHGDPKALKARSVYDIR